MSETFEGPEEFRVRTDRLPVVDERFARLAKRAAKLHVEAPTYQVVREETVPLKWDRNFDRWVRTDVESDAERHELWSVVTVLGSEVALPGGWRLAGTIQHTEVGNAVRLTPLAEEAGVDAARYREGDPVCDHCRTSRNRRDTYLVLSEAGEMKQVGTNCLRDFFGHGNPEALIRFASEVFDAMSDLDDERDFYGGGMRDRNVVNLHDFMAEVIAEIDAHGWLSKTAAAKTYSQRATASEAEYNMDARYQCSDADCSNQKHAHRTIPRPTEEQRMESDAVITFVRDKFEDADLYALSDYENNLRVAVLRDWIEYRETGLAASAVMYVRREQEREVKRREFQKANKNSEWQGSIKERLRNLRLQVRMSRDVEVDSWDGYGTERRTVVKLADADGNLFEFWTGKVFRAEAGSWLVVTGTVTKHDEYNEIKSTVLNRVVFEEAPNEAA